MYGLWYITFGCLALVIIGLILGIVFNRKARKYLRLYKLTSNEYCELDWRSDPDGSKRRELRERYLEYDRLHTKYYNKDNIGWIISIFMSIASIVLISVLIIIL